MKWPITAFWSTSSWPWSWKGLYKKVWQRSHLVICNWLDSILCLLCQITPRINRGGDISWLLMFKQTGGSRLNVAALVSHVNRILTDVMQIKQPQCTDSCISPGDMVCLIKRRQKWVDSKRSSRTRKNLKEGMYLKVHCVN